MVSRQLAMFGGHLSSVSGDIKYLISYMTSQNHEIEGSNNIMSRSSRYVTILPSLVAIGIVEVEI